jgi:hypothetical protein
MMKNALPRMMKSVRKGSALLAGGGALSLKERRRRRNDSGTMTVEPHQGHLIVSLLMGTAGIAAPQAGQEKVSNQRAPSVLIRSLSQIINGEKASSPFIRFIHHRRLNIGPLSNFQTRAVHAKAVEVAERGERQRFRSEGGLRDTL